MAQLQAPVDWTAVYRAERERSKGEMQQRSAYAQAIAESLGYYTPELQREALAPLGQYPTVGEHLFGAPIRGLGKLMGSERMQQVGAPQSFELTGAPPPAPTMPDIPEGVAPEIKAGLQMMGTALGYQQPSQKQPTVPNLPSEIVGTPRLKTKTEREAQNKALENAWQFITRHYQSEEEKARANAYVESLMAQAENQRANAEYRRMLVESGPPITKWDLIKKEMEATGRSYSDVEARIRNISKTKTGKLQLYEYAKEKGYPGTLPEFLAYMEKVKFDPIKIASQVIARSQFTLMELDREQWDEAIMDLAKGLGDQVDTIYKDVRDTGEQIEEPIKKLPPELVNMGMTPQMVQEEATAQGLTEDQVIQKMLNFYSNAYGGGSR